MTAPQQRDPLAGLITVNQAADLLGYDPGSVRQILRRTPGRLRAYKIAGVWLLERESVEAYKRWKVEEDDD